MNSDQVFDVIEEIAATSSKTGKEALIAKYSDDLVFKDVLLAALDPFVTYGVATLPARTTEGISGWTFDGQGMEIAKCLDLLARRQLTGNAARDAIYARVNQLSAKSAELFGRIILKDLRAGFSASTVNKAIPELIPTFDCMLAHKFEESRIKSWPQVVEPKLDGVRVLTFVNVGSAKVSFFSRTGREFNTFDHLKPHVLSVCGRYNVDQGEDEASLLTHVVFDSEVISGSFNKTVGDVRRQSEQATDSELYIFDMLPLETFQKESKSGCVEAGEYLARRKRLEYLFGYVQDEQPLNMVPKYFVNSFKEIHAVYESVRARGLEGLIVKDPKGLYHRRRNHAWQKIKAEESEDLKVIGAFEGEGKYVGMLGGLIVDFKGVEVRVGGGFSDDQRKVFWEEFMKDMVNSYVPGYEPSVVGRIIEVEFHEVTPDGSLRHPRFKRFRDTLWHGEKE